MAKDRPKDPRAPKPPKPRKPPKPPKPLKVPEPEPLETTPAAAVQAASVDRPASRRRGVGLDDLVDLFGRSRLTYGDPVQASGRTVIPVSRVRLSGGLGFGRGGGAQSDDGDGTGGGGGGHLDAHPVGFIDIGPDGSRFVEIPDADRLARNVKAAAGAATALLTALAGARRLGGARRRPPRRQLRS